MNYKTVVVTGVEVIINSAHAPQNGKRKIPTKLWWWLFIEGGILLCSEFIPLGKLIFV